MTIVGQVKSEVIFREIERHGITASLEGDPVLADTLFIKNRRVLISLVSGLFLSAGWVLEFYIQLQNYSIGLYLVAILVGGFSIFRKSLLSLKQLDFNMNVLMTVAVTGAVLIGELSEGAVVALLYSISEALESYTIGRSRDSIRSIMEIAPRNAIVYRHDREIQLPVEKILLGDVLLVKPGEKIPMDGKVISGKSAVNQAAITGESAVLEKNKGDEVFAGTLNQHGVLEIEVTRLVADATITRIISMVEEAQSQRAPSQAFVDRFAKYYTPVVITLAVLISIVPPIILGEPWSSWIYRGLTLLVVACPCALVISTPVAIVSAIGNAARNGVLIKGGVYLEEAGTLGVVAFDKTGTLTKGNPEVTDIFLPADNVGEEFLLRMAASLERMSEHPLAVAIVQKAREKGIETEKVIDFQSITGKGASGFINSQKMIIGSPRLFNEAKIDISTWENLIYKCQSQGKTIMLVGVESKVIGMLAVADIIRENSADSIRQLKDEGVIRTVMLTGDNAATAAAIAAEVGVDEFMADLLPGDKVDAVNELRKNYGKIAMVGDGVNDAPALATATVGIAMGGAGTDTALETADIVLMADDLSKLPFAIQLSRASLKIIKQNIAFSIFIKLAAVLLVFPGWLTLWLAILADMGASVLVTLNGIRLMSVKPKNNK